MNHEQLDHPRPRPRHLRILAIRSSLALFVLAWALLLTYLLLGPDTARRDSQGRVLVDSTGRILFDSKLPTVLQPVLRPTGDGEKLYATWQNLISDFSWHWLVGWDTGRDIALGLVGLLVMMIVGKLLLSCFHVYLSRLAEIPLCFVLGVGACGVVNTGLAFSGRLEQRFALLALLGLLVVLWACSRLALRIRPLAVLAKSNERMLVWRTQRETALMWERSSWHKPHWMDATLQSSFCWMIGILFLAITLLTFYHALFYPVTDWDSLILYVGHARRIFLEHAFPNKVVMQVGVGLGANYPHLFELTGATIATWFNHWSSLYLQLASPLAGLLMMMLVYRMALRISKSLLIAASVALLLRSIPHLITYHVFASNYSFAMLFCTAFFYCVLRYIEDGLFGYFALAILCAAFGVHINYLMGVLWLCLPLAAILAHLPRRQPTDMSPGSYPGVIELKRKAPAPEFYRLRLWPSLFEFLVSPRLWLMLMIGLAIGAMWYVRNWMITGNPVYAFFPELFPATKHLNPEVLASANREWQTHGAGIGIYGETLFERLKGTWAFFVTNPSTAWRWAPSVVGLALPGAILLAISACWQLVRDIGACAERILNIPDDEGGKKTFPPSMSAVARFGLVALFFTVVMFVYHYLMGPFYLYHLLICFAVFGAFMAYVLSLLPRYFIWIFAVWAMFCALAPGLPMAMMGPKLGDTSLHTLHFPGMDQNTFYDLKWDNISMMLERINKDCKGSAILTHENRTLLFDPSIKLIHFDDWEVQQVWGKSSEERLKVLRALGVTHYLQVPFEADHAINERLGHREWIKNGILEKVYQVSDRHRTPYLTLYRFRYDFKPEPPVPPPAPAEVKPEEIPKS